MVKKCTFYHSTGDTPSVSLAGSEVPSSLPAPPSGSRVQPPLKGLAGVAVPDGVQLLNAKLRTAQQRRRGQARYAEYHLECTKANSYTPLGFPRGEAGRLDGSSEPARLTEEGWRQPKCCLHFVRWYQPQIIADYFPLFSFIPHMEKIFIKQAPFSTHRTLHENFGARHPSSVFFVNRFRSADCQKIQLPPGGSQGGSVRIRPRFQKTITAYRTPLRLAKSRLTAVARLHSACASLSQPLQAASSPIGEPRGLTPPSP